jgi:1-pyrroline-5-carboxylate dehydrogenase
MPRVMSSNDPSAATSHSRTARNAAGQSTRTFCRWKSSGPTGKGGLGPYYLAQFMRE